MWNLVASAELVFGIAREQRAQSEGGGSGTFLEPSELKVMRRLLVHGSEVIQGLAELRLQCEEPRPTVLYFAEFFRRVRPLQLRDILADIGPRLFARVVEAKTKLRIQHAQRSGAAAAGGSGGQPHHEQDEQGVASLVLRHFALFPSARRPQDADGGHQRHRTQPPARAPEDEHVGTFLEALFDFVSARLTKFGAPPCPVPSLEPKSGVDAGLDALPRAELQETLVELALFVGR